MRSATHCKDLQQLICLSLQLWLGLCCSVKVMCFVFLPYCYFKLLLCTQASRRAGFVSWAGVQQCVAGTLKWPSVSSLMCKLTHFFITIWSCVKLQAVHCVYCYSNIHRCFKGINKNIVGLNVEFIYFFSTIIPETALHWEKLTFLYSSATVIYITLPAQVIT